MVSRRSGSPIEPRGLSHATAAAYVGVSPPAFLALVTNGLMPIPTVIGPHMVWDRLALDRYFDAASANPRNIDAWRNLAASLNALGAPAPVSQPKAAADEAPTGPRKRGPNIKTLDELGEGEWYELSDEQRDKVIKKTEVVFARKVRSEPMRKLERVALWELFRRQGEKVHVQQMRGVAGQVQDRLVARGFVKYEGENDRYWRITASGSEAIKNTTEEPPPKVGKIWY